MKYHKIRESSIQAELELDWDFLEHSRTYQLFGIIWNNFSQGMPYEIENISLQVIRLFLLSIKISKGAKIRNRYNQVPHLTQDTNGKVTNSPLDTTD